MDLRREDLTRTARAPAKLNLFLELLGRREDGFHELETVMVPLRLADSLSFRPLQTSKTGLRADINLQVRTSKPLRSSSPKDLVPSGPENLVIRALNLLRERSGCELGADVELVKRIPVSAGLGGGSSDAATALQLANHGWGLNWSQQRLSTLAAELGSDIPFFFAGGPAICRGRGAEVERLPPIQSLHVVVVKPPVDLNTAEVYRTYAAEMHNRADFPRPNLPLADFVSKLTRGCRFRILSQMRNALQKSASSLSTWVEKTTMAFSELDFVGHQLSGSGSAYFGICRHAQHARRLANILRIRQLGIVYATRSCP
jgi:4-diphosphocytidyl-2-C-methyl-D-erythritol kinase